MSPGEGPFETFGTGTGGDGGTDDGADETGGPEECMGSALELGDPECDPPPGPTDDCIPEPGASVQVFAPTITETLPETQEAEIAAAVAPDGTEYVATQVLDWESRGMGADPAFCLVQKGIGLYRRNPGDANFEPIDVAPAAGEDLSIEVGATTDLRWYTDPYLAISEGGAVYLSILKWPGIESTQGGSDRGCDSTFGQRDPASDSDEEVQLWVIPPGEAELTKVAVDQGASIISAGLNGPDAQRLDHPRVAVHHLVDDDTDRVVVTFNIFTPNDQDRFVTLDCQYPGGCSAAEAGFGPGSQTELPTSDVISFSNPRLDAAGDLYVGHAHREAGAALAPEVLRFVWNEGDEAWDSAGGGSPSPVNLYFDFLDSTEEFISAPDRIITIDVTPAMAVGQLAGATTPVVWLAWVTRDPMNDDYGIELAAANVDDLSTWTPTVQVPKLFDAMTMRANHWAPELAVDGERNILDLVSYRSDLSSGGVNLSLNAAIWPRLTRFRAHDLLFVGQGSATPNPGVDAPRVGELPARGPGTTSLFLGEYIGLAQRPTSGRGLVAWNLQRDEEGGLLRSDVAANQFDAECPQGIVVDNGTHLTGEAVTTCADPSSASVGLGTFGTTLATPTPWSATGATTWPMVATGPTSWLATTVTTC